MAAIPPTKLILSHSIPSASDGVIFYVNISDDSPSIVVARKSDQKNVISKVLYSVMNPL